MVCTTCKLATVTVNVTLVLYHLFKLVYTYSMYMDRCWQSQDLYTSSTKAELRDISGLLASYSWPNFKLGVHHKISMVCPELRSMVGSVCGSYTL